MRNLTMRSILGVVTAGALSLALGACKIEDLTPRTAYTPGDGGGGDPGVDQNWTPPPVTSRSFTILHTNDEHSHLLGYGPETQYPWLPKGSVAATAGNALTKIVAPAALGGDRSTVGGIVRRQYLINKERAESADPVLVISAGDMHMGTLMHLALTSAAPDLVSMSLMGYDYATLGNHEFDWGPGPIASAMHLAKNFTFGGAVPFIASNMHCGDVEAYVAAGGTTEAGQGLCDMVGAVGSGAPIQPYAIRVLDNGMKVGLLGMLGYEAAFETVSTGLISFSVPDTGAACTIPTVATDCAAGEKCKLGHCVNSLDTNGHIAAMAKDAQTTVAALRAAGADVVVLISHLGDEEDRALAALTYGIDVIIGGHSHSIVAPSTNPANWVSSTVAGHTSSKTIIVQAGEYGKLLGKLKLNVSYSTAGAVTGIAVDASSELMPVDYTIDPLITGTVPANPANYVPTAEFEEAMGLTMGILEPVVAGLDAKFGGLLNAKFGLSSLWAPALSSGHDILGPDTFPSELVGGLSAKSVDTNLAHFVTDAEYKTMLTQGCAPAALPFIVVTANGVLRDNLNFGGTDTSAGAADIFRITPLGASPYEDAANNIPGYPLVMFDLGAAEVYGALEVGVSRGLSSDSFFLSFAGLKIVYEPTNEPFHKTQAIDGTGAPIVTYTGGRIVNMTLVNPDASTTVLYDRTPAAPWISGWQVNPSSTLITVMTDLYIAGFLSAYGLQPRFANGVPDANLWKFVLCQKPGAACTGPGGASAGTIGYCKDIDSNGAPPWDAQMFELKEWATILGYSRQLQAGYGGVPAPLYTGATATPAIPLVPIISTYVAP
jgi:5'-nucleotidase/UDP-sugar diphosphatase